MGFFCNITDQTLWGTVLDKILPVVEVQHHKRHFGHKKVAEGTLVETLSQTICSK